MWVFFQSFILMIGGFIAPFIRQDHAARGPVRHARRRLHHVHLHAAGLGNVHDACDRHRLLCRSSLSSWFGGVRYPRGIPAGLVAIAAGMLIAWGSTARRSRLWRHEPRQNSAGLRQFRLLAAAAGHGHVFAGFEFLGVILVTAIPFGIYDLVEAMDNVESAAAAGDTFPDHPVLTADGVVSLIGCLMGNPFINAVYIGHPGWKSMGGRIGYSAATG